MAAYLITSRGGSGKTTVCAELRQRGLPAFDGDRVEGLSRWEDAVTGEPIAVDPSGYVDYTKVSWNWNGDTLKQLIAANDQLFLCGSASNQERYHTLFAAVFVLSLDPAIHAERLANRESNYGKHPDIQRELIAEHQNFTRHATSMGAIAIDASQPVAGIVDDILERINYEH